MQRHSFAFHDTNETFFTHLSVVYEQTDNGQEFAWRSVDNTSLAFSPENDTFRARFESQLTSSGREKYHYSQHNLLQRFISRAKFTRSNNLTGVCNVGHQSGYSVLLISRITIYVYATNFEGVARFGRMICFGRAMCFDRVRSFGH